MRRRPRADGRRRPTATSRCATASPAPTRTSSARSATASTATRSSAFLEQHHIADKTDCSKCWARPLCSGGCYHEAHTRYGDTGAPEPALLRVDPRLDRHLSADLRRARRSAIRNSSRSSTRRSKGRGSHVTHLKAINTQGRRVVEHVAETKKDVVALQQGRRRSSRRTFRSAARWCSRRVGKRTRPAAPPGSASRSSATSSTATSAASGRRRCRTSSITRRTGPRKCAVGAEGLAQNRSGVPGVNAER